MSTRDVLRHQAINEVLENCRQGDCISTGEHWFVHRFNPIYPHTKQSEEAAGSEGDLAEEMVPGFVILSHTCELVRSCDQRPYVEIAPLVKVLEGRMREIERGRHLRYALVPALRERMLAADLDRVMTVEKAIIAEWGNRREVGCRTDKEARDFARALARKRERFAFPDDFVEFARKLSRRISEKHDKQSDEGCALRSLREIRVRAVPSWDAAQITLTFWFLREEEMDIPAEGLTWNEIKKRWMDYIQGSGRFVEVEGYVLTLDDLTGRDYVDSDRLDLEHLSSREAGEV